jgi:hypothetical protein
MNAQWIGRHHGRKGREEADARHRVVRARRTGGGEPPPAGYVAVRMMPGRSGRKPGASWRPPLASGEGADHHQHPVAAVWTGLTRAEG